MNSATESVSNPVDITDHHHHSNIKSSDHYHKNESLSDEIAAVIVPTASEFVEIKSNMPMRIDNNLSSTSSSLMVTKSKISTNSHPLNAANNNDNDSDDGNDINKNRKQNKTSWVKFDDDDSQSHGKNNNYIRNNDSNTTNTINITNSNSNDNNTKSTSPTPTAALATTAVNTTKLAATTASSTKRGIPFISGPPAPAQSNKIQTTKFSSSEISPAPAVLSHVNLNSVSKSTTQSTSTTASSTTARNDTPKSSNSTSSNSNNNNGAAMRTIELSTGRIREGFANGDIIVTLLPTNTRWPWVTPAIFRPELVPEELMAQGLTLTVEEYVNAMETLVNDYRFTVYNICYKRVLVCWILFAFFVLLTLLFSGLKGIPLFSLGVGWLFLNAAAIIFCMWIKLRLSRGLEKCLARVNKQLIRHKIILILDDRGRISCHKVNLCFLYFDPAQCIAYLNEFIERNEQNGTNIQAGWESKLDLDVNDIVIQGSNPVRLSRKQVIATEIFLSYLQRWGKDFLRRRLDWTVNEAGVHETPRHLMSSICPCQYIEEILNKKIKTQNERSCCTDFFRNSCGHICCQ